MNKYKIISLQPLSGANIAKTAKNLPDSRPRTLSLRCPTNNLQLQCLKPVNPIIADAKKYSRKASSLNLKQKPQLVLSKRRFDNRIFCNQRMKSLKKPQQLPGLSRADLDQRKQSHLNTYFNIRKNKLKEITKENKKIYVRINSQKSLYSSRQLNKSTDSISNSRLSRKSSQKTITNSRMTDKSKKNIKKVNLEQKRPQQIKIQSKDINKIQNFQVKRYLNIFCNHLNTNSKSTEQKNVVKNQTLRGKQNRESVTSGLEKILEQLQQKKTGKRNLKVGLLI